ncbi:TPA: hypothetical protein PJF92_000088 [Escherichia coli]|nr:hypothetical protein [Escherichia coli]HDH7160027.1 hypothetical protein [Escherichia coli]
MLKISDVEPSTALDGLFTDGSVAGGISPTRLVAAWFNALQTELVNVVESSGMELDPDDSTQVLQALTKMFLSRSSPFADIAADGTEAIAQALANLQLGEAAKLDAPTGNLVTSGNATFPLAGNKKLIIQWGRVSPPSPGSSTAVSFSATFNVLLGLGMALNGTSGTTGCAGATASNITNSGFNWTMLPGVSYGALASSYWIAVGM